MDLPPQSHIAWDSYHRIISSRFPPIDLFERVAEPSKWELLAEIESMTNPRVRDSIGEISLVPADRRVGGMGASYNMAPFTHFSPEKPSRFSDGRNYGVFYAAKDFETALREVAHVRFKFYSATENNPLQTEERVLKGKIDAMLFDVRGSGYEDIHDPDDYSKSQALGSFIREQNGNGIVYNSVRNASGQNFAAFWPDVMDIPIQTKHISFHWDGKKIDRYFDYQTEKWINI